MVKIPKDVKRNLPKTEEEKRKEEETKKRNNPSAGSVGVYTDERGKASGVTLPDGRSFLGLSPKDVEEMARQEAERVELPPNAMPIPELNKQADLEQGLLKLDQQSLTEQQALTKEYVNNQAGENTFTRAVKAGEAFLDSVPLLNKLPNIKDPENVGNFPSAIIGKAVTSQIFGMNLANVLGLGNEISEIEGDITELRTSQRDILREATATKNYAGALGDLEIIEESIRVKQDDLYAAIEQSPKDVATGKNAAEFMYRNLRAIQASKRILLRAQLTGDQLELISYVNSLESLDVES